jgi:hypothetical protein
MKTILKTILTTAAICMAVFVSTSTAQASVPSPDQDPGCGGQCQVICINGCDSNAHYSGLQARCTVGSTKTYVMGGYFLAAFFETDSKGDFCDDGYTCDFGPCGRAGERPCQDFLSNANQNNCQACTGNNVIVTNGKCVQY